MNKSGLNIFNLDKLREKIMKILNISKNIRKHERKLRYIPVSGFEEMHSEKKKFFRLLREF
jgi:hypothetical protein